ncbi:hypothetical protein FOCC_FOCC006397 [Frankliniella occidentalis]|nr:hypothetical protein FOCC_FOCC006397 [Frankliniella occidentalis]
MFGSPMKVGLRSKFPSGAVDDLQTEEELQDFLRVMHFGNADSPMTSAPRSILKTPLRQSTSALQTTPDGLQHPKSPQQLTTGIWLFRRSLATKPERKHGIDFPRKGDKLAVLGRTAQEVYRRKPEDLITDSCFEFCEDDIGCFFPKHVFDTAEFTYAEEINTLAQWGGAPIDTPGMQMANIDSLASTMLWIFGICEVTTYDEYQKVIKSINAIMKKVRSKEAILLELKGSTNFLIRRLMPYKQE